MLETIINAGTVITLFAIAAPFIFVLLVIRMTTGGHRHDRRSRRYDRRADSRKQRDDEEDLEDIAKGLKDLNRRIDNLETLKKDDKDRK